VGKASLGDLDANVTNITHSDLGTPFIADDCEGVAGVTLRLYREGDVVGSSAPGATTISVAGGSYLFSNLKPGRQSIPGAGTDGAVDDLSDENGTDNANASVHGQSSIVLQLSPGSEPIDAISESSFLADMDNANDANTDPWLMASPEPAVRLQPIVSRCGKGTLSSMLKATIHLSDWSANWKVFDRSKLGDGWISSSGTSGHNATLEEDFTTSNASLPKATLRSVMSCFIINGLVLA
jgi:hypothetical protein